MRFPTALCLFMPLVLAAGDAVEYSVYPIPGVTWNPASAVLDSSAVAPGGRWVAAVLNTGGTRVLLRWSGQAGATATISDGGAAALVAAAIDDTGLVVGYQDSAGPARYPVYAAGGASALTALGNQGWFAGLSSAGNPVGGLFNGASDFTTFDNLRAFNWADGAAATATELSFTGAGAAIAGLPAVVDRVSPDGGRLFGHFTPASGDALGFFVTTWPGMDAQIVSVPAEYTASTLGDWIAGFNDGTGVLRIGDYNEASSGPTRRSYRWTGSALVQVAVPTDTFRNTIDARGGAVLTGASSTVIVGEAAVTGTLGDHSDLAAFRWVVGQATPDLLTDLVPAAVNNIAYPAGISAGGVIVAESTAGGAVLLVPAPEVTISSAADDPQYEDGVSFTCTVTRAAYGQSPVNTDWALTVNLAYAGTAVASADYAGPATVVIPAGQTSVDFTVTLISNAGSLADHLLVISVDDRDPAATGPQGIYRIPDGGSQISRGIFNVGAATHPHPTVSVAATTNAFVIHFTVDFDEAVTTFDESIIGLLNVTNGTIQGLSHVSGNTYQIDVTADGQGAVLLAIPAGICAGATGLNLTSNTAVTLWDSQPPDAPVILACATDSGSSATDFITSDIDPIISGTAEIGAMVTLHLAGTAVGSWSGIADGSSNWSIPVVPSLAEGTYTLTATATDAAGNVSFASDPPQALVIDITPPAAPTIAGPAATTNDTSPLMSGTAEPDADVIVYDGATAVATATALGDGTWSIATSALVEGSHSLTAKARDLAGNLSVASSSAVVVIDLQPPTLTIGAPTPSHPLSAGHAFDYLVTYTDPSGIAGIDLTAGDIDLVVTDCAVPVVEILPSAVADSKIVRLTVQPGADGTITFNINSGTAVDGAGNGADTATAPSPVEVDNTPPGAPEITTPSAVTAATQPVIRGGFAEVGGTVRIYEGSTLLGIGGVVDGTGTWSVAVSAANPLAEGAHDITARVTDIAGNESLDSDPVTLTVDLSGPLPTITGATVSSSASIQVTVTFSAAVGGFTAGDVIAGGTAGGSRSVTVTAVNASVYTVDVAGIAAPDGDVTIKVPADAATAVTGGALSRVSTPNPFTLTWSTASGGGGGGVDGGGGGGGGCGFGAALALLAALSLGVFGLGRRR